MHARAARATALTLLLATSGIARAASDEIASVYVFLDGPSVIQVLPAASAQPRVLTSPATKTATRARLRQLTDQHAAFRPRLEALGATVVADIKRVANALQIEVPADRLAELEQLPGVARVAPVTRFHLLNTTAVPHIGATELWSAGVPVHGDGMRIGIIDSGVDYTHATFGGPGVPSVFASNDPKIIEPGSFPTERVDGTDIVGDEYEPEDPQRRNPIPDDDPLDCASIGHGTHVAGIAAGGGVLSSGAEYEGPYDMSLEPSDFSVGPGVAPRAKIYAIKVTGCGGSSSHIAAGLEYASDPDGDGDLSDRLDVVNLSMGASFGAVSPVELEMAASMIRAGSVFVAAAGNDGNSYAPFFTLSGPSSLVEAISVGATLDSTASFLALTVDSPEAIAGPMPAAEADFSRPLWQVGVVHGALVLAQPDQACNTLSNAGDVTGNIALIRRGGCTFLDKFGAAESAGAVAVVVVDQTEQDAPFRMGGRGSTSLPGVLVRMRDGEAVAALVDDPGVTVTLDPGVVHPVTLGPDYMAGFSSRGPVATHGAIKPDFSAPGSGIVSARVGTGNRGVEMGGTSMASPMAAGAVVLVRQARPEFSPHDVKAAMMNSAAPVLTLDGSPFPVSLAGAGRVDVAAAAGLDLLARAEQPEGAISAGFGAIVAAEPVTEQQQILVENRGAAQLNVDLHIEPDRALPGVSLSISPQALELAPGASERVELSLSVDPGSLGRPGPDAVTPLQGLDGVERHYLVEASGRVMLSSADGSQTAQVPYHAAVRAATRVAAGTPTGCAASPDQTTIAVPLLGRTHLTDPPTSAFQLVFEQPGGTGPDPEHPEENVLALGVATDLAAAASFDLATVFFGVAVEGEWVTPSAAEWSVVYLLLDTDEDVDADFLVTSRAATINPFGMPSLSDLPLVQVLDLETGEVTVDDAVLNVVRPDVFDTLPYNNSVLIYPVPLFGLRLSRDDMEIGVAAVSSVGYGEGNPPEYRQVDLGRLALDTTYNGLPGKDRLGNPTRLPIYGGDGPVNMRVDPQLAASGMPDLLLLHHANVAGRRFEIVTLPDLDTLDSGNLILTHTELDEAHAGRDFTLDFTVHNESSVERDQVVVEVTVDGSVVAVLASQGTCDAGEPVSCELGTLAAGASATVSLTVDAPAVQDDVVLSFEASTSAGSECETDLDDNRVAGTVTVQGQGPPRLVQEAGGCGVVAGSCGGWALVLLVGLALARRFRNRRQRNLTGITRQS